MRLRQFVPALIFLPYVLLALLILIPLLSPGFILTMDMVFTPHVHMPVQIDNTYAFYAGLHMLNLFIAGDILEKGLLLTILLLSGIGMHRLLQRFIIAKHYIVQLLACYAGGLVYVINPFVYSRLMMGQFAVVFGYALLPWFLLSFLRFMKEPGWASLVRCTVWTIAISIISIHTFAFLGFIVPAVFLGLYWSHRRDRVWFLHRIRWIAGWVFVCLVLSSYWLVPALVGKGAIAQSIQGFGEAERQAYATADTNGNGRVLAILGLQGFWADTQNLYVLPGDAINAWWVYRGLFWVIIGLGMLHVWRQNHRLMVYASMFGTLATILALGFFNDWIIHVIPLFAGFREPQKFVALLVLVYSYFIASGVCMLGDLFGRIAAWLSVVPAIAVGALILCYTPTMLWGFYGQLVPRQYPQDWYAVNDILNRQPAGSKILFLPWHLYMSFDFADRIIATPAAKFFDRQVIASDDPELSGTQPQVPDPTKNTISHTILPEAKRGRPISGQLRVLSIGYILLAKELDYKAYDFLNAQPNLRLWFETNTLKLYKVGT